MLSTYRATVDGDGINGRLTSPAARRNIDPIGDALATFTAPGERLLELASGTGEHAAALTRRLPGLLWQPSDADESRLASIEAWRADPDGPATFLPAILLDATTLPWPVPTAAFDVVLAVNLLHVLPRDLRPAVFAGARHALTDGGRFAVYGPMRRGAEFFSEGNVRFDRDLRAHDATYGLPDIDDLTLLADDFGFAAPEILALPASNHVLVFRRPT